MQLWIGSLIALLAATVRVASADASPEPSRVTIGYLRTASANVSDEVERGEASVREVHLQATVARWETSLGTVLLGGLYERRQLDLIGRFDDETLHELKPSLTLRRETGPWRLVARIAPGVATDFEDVSGDDVSIDALAQIVYRRSAKTSWVFGVAADRTFAATDVYPIAGFTHVPSDRTWLGLVFPRPSIRFATTPRTTLYWRAEPVGNRWHVGGGDEERDFDLAVEGVRTGFGIEWRARDELRVRLELGRELGRGVDTVDEAGVERAIDPEDATYVSVSIELMP